MWSYEYMFAINKAKQVLRGHRPLFPQNVSPTMYPKRKSYVVTNHYSPGNQLLSGH